MSTFAAAVPVLAALVGAVFAASVLLQYWRRRKPYQLFWGAGLLLFTLATSMEAVSELAGWSEGTYRVYYAFAPSLVGFLGLGSVFLLSSKAGRYFALYILPLFALFAVLVGTAAVATGNFAYASPAAFQAGSACAPGAAVTLADGRAFTCGLPIGGAAMPSYVRIMSPLFTIPGSIALIGIAGYSFWKGRGAFNIPIALGAVVIALGGVLARFGEPGLLYATELAGIALMYLGFIRASGLPGAAHAAEPAKAG